MTRELRRYVGTIDPTTQRSTVWVEDGDGKHPLPIRTPKGHSMPVSEAHSWGYGGSGPAQLAHDLLLDVTREEPSRPMYQDFKWAIISPLPQDMGWAMEAGEIIRWANTWKAVARA